MRTASLRQKQALTLASQTRLNIKGNKHSPKDSYAGWLSIKRPLKLDSLITIK